jgi:hypothetical protein
VTDLRPDQPADPLEERRRIEEAFAPLPQCPRCRSQVPAWAMVVIDEGHGRVCRMCATDRPRDGYAEVY